MSRKSNTRAQHRLAAAAAVSFTLLSPVAFGHAGHAPVESTFAALSHLVGGLDHLLFLVAVGVFASRRILPSLLKLSVVAAGVALASVHLASSLAMAAAAAVCASAIIAAGFGLGRVWDVVARRARS